MSLPQECQRDLFFKLNCLALHFHSAANCSRVANGWWWKNVKKTGEFIIINKNNDIQTINQYKSYLQKNSLLSNSFAFSTIIHGRSSNQNCVTVTLPRRRRDSVIFWEKIVPRAMHWFTTTDPTASLASREPGCQRRLAAPIGSLREEKESSLDTTKNPRLRKNQIEASKCHVLQGKSPSFDVVVVVFSFCHQKKTQTKNSRQLTKLVGFLVKASFVGD